MTFIITRKKTSSYVIKKTFFFMNLSKYFAFQCLATKARPHLRFTTSLENKFSSRSLQRQSRSIMAFFAFQCLVPYARPHLSFSHSCENKFSSRGFQRRCRSKRRTALFSVPFVWLGNGLRFLLLLFLNLR